MKLVSTNENLTRLLVMFEIGHVNYSETNNVTQDQICTGFQMQK
jgi:hypothetical protein